MCLVCAFSALETRAGVALSAYQVAIGFGHNNACVGKITSLIDQSGLNYDGDALSYVSGVTDFNEVVGFYEYDGWGWIGYNIVSDTNWVTFDLRAVKNISQLAYWNGSFVGDPVSLITIHWDNDNNFENGTTGSFGEFLGGDFAFTANVLDIPDVASRFFHFVWVEGGEGCDQLGHFVFESFSLDTDGDGLDDENDRYPLVSLTVNAGTANEETLPDANSNGAPDTVGANCDEACIIAAGMALDQAPTAVDVFAATLVSTASASQSATVALEGADAESDELTYTVVDGPANGSLSDPNNADATVITGAITSQTLTYTPDSDFTGTDTFTYRVNDGVSDSATTYTATITVFDAVRAQAKQIGADIDGESAGDQSGTSVALSSDGQTLAVGAPGIDEIGSARGHVRVYAWNGSAWSQLGADIDGEAVGDSSGWPVVLSSDGQTLAVGARLNDGNGSDAGHVRVYDLKTFSPEIGGTANRAAVSGVAYEAFDDPGTALDPTERLTASDTDLVDSNLTFSATAGGGALPGWLAVDAVTGALSGTPTADDVGAVTSIVLSVSDGTLSDDLPAFDLTVLLDTDEDGQPDDCDANCVASGFTADADDDNDQVDDVDSSWLPLDAFPLNSAASVDTDGDGAPDTWNAACDAACQSASTLVLDAFPTIAAGAVDTDDDGQPDDWTQGCDQACINQSQLTLDLDDDDDGYSDTDELTNNQSDPKDANSTPPDADFDFLSDLNDPDDDNDGVSDSDEATAGTDPLTFVSAGLKLAWLNSSELTVKDCADRNDCPDPIVIPVTVTTYNASGDPVVSPVVDISDLAFIFISAPSGVSLPEGLQTIGDNSFLGNYGSSILRSLTIPSTVSAIESSAFLSAFDHGNAGTLIFKGARPASLATNAFSDNVPDPYDDDPLPAGPGLDWIGYCTGQSGWPGDPIQVGNDSAQADPEPNAYVLLTPQPDCDGDRVLDTDDAFPTDPDETADTDSDGLGDNADQCDSTATAESDDINASGCGPSERDTDGDGTNDNLDAFPNNPNETLDSDGDGYGDNEETEAGTDPNDADDQPIQSGLPIWLLYEASKS